MKNCDWLSLKPAILKNLLRWTKKNKEDFEKLLEGDLDGFNLGQQEERYHKQAIPDLHILGDLIYFSGIHPPFDYGTDLILTRAKNADGSNSFYHCSVSETQKDQGELNVACLKGQWFDLSYNNVAGTSDDLFEHACAMISKVVQVSPFDRDVLARVTTTAYLPATREEVYYLAKGDVAKVGVKGNLNTSVWWNDGEEARAITVDKQFLAATRAEGLPDVDFYEPNPSESVLFRLPAGTREFLYSCRLEGMATTSHDALDLEVGSQYGLAVLDLRHKTRHRNYHVLVDRFGNTWDKYPFGGAKLSIILKFYEVGSIGIVH